MRLIHFALPVLAVADVDKVIFLVPPLTSKLSGAPLPQISPRVPIIRHTTYPPFSNLTHPNGTEIWFEMTDLAPNETYEVRVCWPATSPTDFVLNIFTSAEAAPLTLRSSQTLNDEEYSRLYLRLNAAATFYSSDSKLMQSPRPVEFVLILDRYVLGLIPESLISAVTTLVLGGLISWIWIAPLVYNMLVYFALGIEEVEKSKRG